MENQNTVKSLLSDVPNGRSSKKDEVKVMTAMLNDPTYEVTVYGSNGPEGTYNPCKDFRSMCASVISGAAKVSNAEATALMENYTVRRAEAESMVNVSKEFINTYLHTGRKLPLGGREESDIALSLKKVEKSTRLYPQKTGVNDDGTDKYAKVPTVVPAHESIRVHAPCPTWVKTR